MEAKCYTQYPLHSVLVESPFIFRMLSCGFWVLLNFSSKLSAVCGHGIHWGAALNCALALKLGNVQVKPGIIGAFHKSQTLAIKFLFLVSGSWCCFAKSSDKAIRRYRVWWRAFWAHHQSCSTGISTLSARRKLWENGLSRLCWVGFFFRKILMCVSIKE